MVGRISRPARHFFQGVRWINLLLIALYYIVARYVFFFSVPLDQYLELAGATLLIAAGGNLENDLRDVLVDKANRKPNFFQSGINRKKAFLPYLLYVAGWVLGSRLGWQTGKPWAFFYFASVIILLVNYNIALKKMPLIGNFVVSFLTALSVFQPAFFFDLPAPAARRLVFLVVLVFLANLNREIIKDITDRKGDRLAGFQTLGVISVRTALQTAFAGNLLLTLTLAAYALFNRGPIGRMYFGLLAVATAATGWYLTRGRKNLALIKNIYKWIILAGIAGIMLR